MSWGSDLHKCSKQEFYKSNPHAKKWDIDAVWHGFDLIHSGDTVKIIYCPWCGVNLETRKKVDALCAKLVKEKV